MDFASMRANRLDSAIVKSRNVAASIGAMDRALESMDNKRAARRDLLSIINHLGSRTRSATEDENIFARSLFG